jgi:hypothetical protein
VSVDSDIFSAVTLPNHLSDAFTNGLNLGPPSHELCTVGNEAVTWDHNIEI